MIMAILKIISRSDNGVHKASFEVNSIDDIVDSFTKEVMHANAQGYKVIPIVTQKIFNRGYNFSILGQDADILYDALCSTLSSDYRKSREKYDQYGKHQFKTH